MPLELDHFFICTSAGAPAAEQLIRFGLAEGAPSRHPGQGTANRRFFFEDAFLELLWVDDPAEAQSAAVRRTGLWERWSKRDQGASPFGICLRPAGDRQIQAPFATWEYRPPYLPESLAIQMADNSQMISLPLLFFIPFGRRPDADDEARRPPLDHPAGLRAITRLHIGVSRADAAGSLEQRTVERECPLVSFVPADEHLLEIGFDNETQTQHHDFRPKLPLVFRW